MSAIPINCMSSNLTRYLAEWRDFEPKTSENEDHEHLKIPVYSLFTRVTVEVASCILVVTSIIECYAYGILFVLYLPIYPVNDNVAKLFWTLHSSACFTVKWNLLNVVSLNFKNTKLYTNEEIARRKYTYDIDNPLSVTKYIINLALIIFPVLVAGFMFGATIDWARSLTSNESVSESIFLVTYLVFYYLPSLMFLVQGHESFAFVESIKENLDGNLVR